MLLKSKSFRSAPIALNANPARGRGIILFHRGIFHSEIPLLNKITLSPM